MSENSWNFGKEAENHAANYMQKQGYQILERNWHFGHKELDIIAQKGNDLVIVEVKARGTEKFEHPLDAVNKRKQRFMVEAANAYVETKNLDVDTRFDVICIIPENGKFHLEHVEDAFQPHMI